MNDYCLPIALNYFRFRLRTPNELIRGSHFMLLLSIYVMYSNVNYIYLVSSLEEINVYNLYKLVATVNMSTGKRCIPSIPRRPMSI